LFRRGVPLRRIRVDVKKSCLTSLLVLVFLATSASVATATTTPPPGEASPLHSDALSADASWLETLNAYRAGSGLGPVVNEPRWTSGIDDHLRYLARTPPQFRLGAYASEHLQNPASPFYSEAGAAAAKASNLGYGWTDRDAIENFLSAPFHAIGLLRPGLRRSAFASLDINVGIDTIRGLVDDRSTAPVLFPGDGSVTSLSSYRGNESPDPLESCPGFRVPSGLPILALLPAAPARGVQASVRSAGRFLDVCTITAESLVSSDPIGAPSARATLRHDNAVVIVPREPLSNGIHTVRLSQPGLADLVWSFTVVPPPDATDGRVLPGHPLRVHVASGSKSVAGTVTITEPLHSGFATVYPCSVGLPSTSNVNFDAGQAVASAFVVRADDNGDICVNVSTPTAVIVDLIAATDRPLAIASVRSLDTRFSAPLPADRSVRLSIGARGGSTVIGTVTMIAPVTEGHLSIGTCDDQLGRTSSVNVVAGETAANLFVAHADDDGYICVRSSTRTNIVVDRSAATVEIDAVQRRLLDSRSTKPLEPRQTMKVHIDGSGATVLFGTVTAVAPTGDGYLVVYDCDQPMPPTSNANFAGGHTIATSFAVGLSASRNLCVTSSTRTNVVVDESATSEMFGTVGPAVRLIDTRSQPHRFVSRLSPAGASLRTT
jgi:hypothetical protein